MAGALSAPLLGRLGRQETLQLHTRRGRRQAGMEVLWLHNSLASRIQLGWSDTVVPSGAG